MLSPLFAKQKPVIGMIHIGALPGSPACSVSLSAVMEGALLEARIFRDAGVDGVMIENMHDVPYLRGRVGPEIVSAMAVMGRAVKAESALPAGVQILAGANMEAMAVAHAAGLDFIRAEGYAFAHIADEGWMEACAGELLRYRRQIGADRVQVWADVKKKHSSHAVTTDISLGATAEAVEFMRGDAVIVTGSATGRPPGTGDVSEAKSHCGLPVLLGSGVTASNIADFYEEADGFIIGSYFKRDGHWRSAVDPARVEALMEALNRLRGK